MKSPRSTARIAGLLYLLLVISGTFAHLYVRASIYEPGNASATLENILASSTLFRVGIVADIFMATVFVLLGVVLYVLLKDVDSKAATTLVVFVSVGAGMILANLIFHVAAWLVATDASYAGTLSAEDGESLVLLLMNMHHYGYAIAGIFFGLWLLPMGFLAYKSSYFPNLLGILLMVAGASWIVDTLVTFAAPEAGEVVHFIITLPTFAEFALLLYLLIVGVRTTERHEPLTKTAQIQH